jgi:hypothetical protein
MASELHCQIQKILSPDEPTLTVGERFGLDCEGAVPAFNSKTLQLKVDEADKYKLKLLAFQRRSDSQLRLEVLSDQVGKHDLQTVQLTDGTNVADLKDLRFEVRSVQDPQNPVQEPYGALGPIGLSIPWFYWMGLIAVLSLAGLLVVSRIYKRIQRRKLMQEIVANASASSPEAELFLQLRRFQRDWTFLLNPEQKLSPADSQKSLENLNGSYRLFLSRTFELPATRWSTSRTLRTLRREQKQLSGERFDEIRKILRELDRSQKVNLRSQDLEQLLGWVREDAEKIIQERGVPR